MRLGSEILLNLLIFFSILFISSALEGESTASKRLEEKRLDNSPYIRPCYFTNWAQYRKGRAKFLTTDYKPGLCTHIIYAFAYIDKNDFSIKTTDPTDLKAEDGGPGQYELVNSLKKTQTDLKTLLSIGGWSFGTKIFKEMSSDPNNRAAFINSAIRWVRLYNFDGIDLDWEYPKKKDPNYVALLKEMRSAIDAEAKLSQKTKLLLTAAVAAGTDEMKGYDIPNIVNSLDFINVMTYDFWTPDDNDGTTGMNSPLYNRSGLQKPESEYNTDWAARAWNKEGFPKEKVVIGIAPYGHGWILKDPNDIQPGSSGNSPAPVYKGADDTGTAAYFELCEMLAEGATRYWHDEHQVPWLIYQGQWWSYDDVQSVKIKMDYIKKNGFGGAMVWALDLDDFNGKCSNGGGKLYPIIGTIAKELAGIDI